MQPQQILHYDILERLGEGPHGESFRARDTVNGQEVVLKLIARAVFQPENRIQPFRESMLGLANLSDPHLAAPYAIEETADDIVIVHEFVEGASLGTILQRGPLPYEGFLDYAIQISEGVRTLHRQGLIHGHISTDNVIVDHDGTIKLLDYGLPALGPAYIETEPGESRPEAPADKESSPTPPEADADFFALGGLFYEMLTRRSPFSEKGGQSTAGLGVYPPEVRLLVEKLLSAEKSEQFSGVDELLITLHEMKQFLEHPPEAETTKQISPRVYLIISIIAFLLIIFWWVVTSYFK